MGSRAAYSLSSSGDGRAPSAPPPSAVRQMFSARAEELVLSWEPNVGFVLLGPCMRRGGGAWLRAVDIENRRVGWDGLPLAIGGEGAPMLPTRRDIAARGNTVYVAQSPTLVAADVATGRERWRATIGEPVEWTASRAPAGGCQIAEPFDAEGSGAVVLPTPDRALHAFDRETGRALWRRGFERRIALHAIGRSGSVCVDLDGRVEILRAREGDVLASFGGADGARVEGTIVEGRCVACAVRGWGPERADGILVADGQTGEVISFDELRDVRARCMLAAGGGRIFAALAAGDADCVAAVPSRTVAALPWRDTTVSALRVAGPALIALVRAEGARRAIGLDARTLEPRYDLGVLGELPEGTAPDQLQSDGRVAVVVKSPQGARNQCELHAFDAPTGAPLWQRAVGEWIGHYFLGGQLVVVSRGRLEILEPTTGRPSASYPFA